MDDDASTELPLAPVHAPGVAAEPVVLLVDDDPGIMRMLQLVFTMEGYTVVQATDGAEALRKLQEWVPAAIVLDLRMGGMDGREFYRELRSRGLNYPVVISSAHGAREAQRELHAEASIGKPFDPEDLVALVNSLRARPASDGSG